MSGSPPPPPPFRPLPQGERNAPADSMSVFDNEPTSFFISARPFLGAETRCSATPRVRRVDSLEPLSELGWEQEVESRESRQGQYCFYSSLQQNFLHCE